MKALVFALLAWIAQAAFGQAAPTVRTEEPRAYGWLPGDVIVRHATVDAGEAFTLDAASLPKPGRLGNAFELRSIGHDSERMAGGRRHLLRLEYQVFFSPTATRTLELPPVLLRFDTAGRTQEVRIEAWPVTVSPLVPPEVSPRRGLGELQPDLPPPLADMRPLRTALAATTALALLPALFLLHAYVGLPWLARRRRPFAQAWRALRRVRGDEAGQRRAAFEQLHAALNASAGRALFAGDVARFVGEQPQFAPLQHELSLFFERSQAEFFGSGDGGNGPALPELLALCRRARDIERGGR